MTDRVSTLLDGRRERLERMLGRSLAQPKAGSSSDLRPKMRAFLLEEAEDLYWNELEWENITDEEALEGGPLAELTFPGFLAFIRGLLLTEVMPDALAPAEPRPEVVEDVLRFLAGRVLELEERLSEDGSDPEDRSKAELDMTSRLVDLVLYLLYGLDSGDVDKIEAHRAASG